MERRRAAVALLALAACIVCSSAAPTASNPTALDVHDGPAEGCYYNFQHYGEGDRIMTNEPCLNCTCHNKMLMCYLRVCPFTKAIGQDCTVEKRADQCCPIVTCPDVPVDLLTSTSTSSPAEYGPTGVGKLDKYGCSINNKYFPEGSKVPSSPNKPCEHCYCIRNMTTCVMQECTLHVDGCTPIYHKDVCCPVRYSCDHLEDEIPLLDDMTTTVRPTQGFLLTTPTMMPVTQMTQDCIHDEQIFPDGASIKTDKACEHCYCMKGDIVCVVQECGTPMENEGKNCTSLAPRHGQCCPDTYICEGDEPSLELTTEDIDSTSVPPRRHGVEGSGYRNEPDEPLTEKLPFEHDIEGSGDVSETEMPTKVSPEITDELLLITTEKEALPSQTTEADKGLNTIMDNILEKEPSVTFGKDSFMQSTESVLVTSTESKATMADEIITSDGVTSNESDEIVPTDISKEKETPIILPEQSTLRDELSGYSVTESTTTIKKETEVILGSTDNVVPFDITTTESPIINSISEKDNFSDETPEMNKIDNGSEMTNSDISVTEQNKPDVSFTTVKEMNIVDDGITVSSNKDVSETTINPVDNEVDYIPGRIPGEGDCLLNGVTYSNYTSVPSTNNCHTGCKCISSIIKCDPIICSPPPEYMENMNDCQTSYDSPDSCCPTYVCSAKETSLPQSHSHTSVTETSKPVVTEECNGNNCSSVELEQPSPAICDSGKCENGPKQNDCGINGCQSEEKPPSERPVSCSGDECSVSPIVSCDGEHCESTPNEEKDISVSPSKPICNNDDGCDNIKDASPPTDDECKDETCRRKDTFETGTNVHAECSGTQCKVDDEQKTPLIEPTVSPVTEYVVNEKDIQTISDELGVPETASSVPSIISTEKAITMEPISDIGTEPATVKVQLPDKTLTDMRSEEPIRSITESSISITDNTVTKINDIDRIVTANTVSPQEDISKSDTSPTELNIMSDIATEKTKTTDETFIDHGSYTSSIGLDGTVAVTESNINYPVDISSENKDTPSQGSNSDVYETKPDEPITKLPMLIDEKEINSMEIPNIPSNEGKITANSEGYPITTEYIEAISVSDVSVGTTKTQENVNIELPNSEMEIGSGNEDHSEIIPSQPQDLATEIFQDDKTEDNNKFTTVKSIPLQEVTENPTPVKAETQSILLETVSLESYTELPQTVGTKSDVPDDSDSYTTGKEDESGNKFMESTPSSGVKQPEEYSTKLDETVPEDDHAETITENQEYATTERKPSILNDDDKNVEKQTTISQMKYSDENEIGQEIQTNLPNVDKITERTELEMNTESQRETEMEDSKERDSQTKSPFDNKATDLDLDKDLTVTESAQTSTVPQDISATKDFSPAAVLRDEGDTQIMSSTDKNVINMTPPSDESVTETKYATDVPDEKIDQHYPTKDFKLTTLLQDTGINIETTTAVIISEEKPQTPDLQVSEKPIEENEIIKDVTTALPNEIINEDMSPSRLPDVILENEDTTGIPSDEEKLTTSSIYNTKEKDITENNLEDITRITISDVPISESITEKINMPPREYPKQESSAGKSSEKPDINENDFITYSPPSQTGSVDFDKYSTIASGEYVINQKPEFPVSEINDVAMSTSIPLLNQDDEITTEKMLIPDTVEKESTSEKSEYDIIQSPVPMSTESNIDNNIFQNSVTEKNEIVELSTILPTSQTKATEISQTAFESEMQNTIIQQEDEKPSSELPKQTTEVQSESKLTPQQEHQTVPSVSEDQSIDIEDVRTTESVSIKQEDLPVYPDMPVENIHTISDESYATATELETDIIKDLMTTEVVPVKHEELPNHQESSPMATDLPKLDTSEQDDISKIDSDTLTTESLITSKPSLISSTEDSTKLNDMVDEQPLPSKIPESVIESTVHTETESVTEPEDNKLYTTEKQYVSKTDQEEVPKIQQLPEEQNTVESDTESVSKQDNLGTFTTEKQYVTKSHQEDISKTPVLVDEESSSQSDIENITKLDDSEPFTTEKQYVNKAEQEDIPKIPVLVDEQSSSQSDFDSVTKLDDSEPFTTEKQYVNKAEQEDIPKIPVLVDEQSSSQSDFESVTKLDDSELFTTEKQYVNKAEQEDIPKIPVLVDEQSSSQSDFESVTKLDDSEPFTTEKQYVNKTDQEDIPKIPVLVDEQSSSQSDIERVTKLDNSELFTTERQYVTKFDEVPKIPKLPEEQNVDQTYTEVVIKEDSELFTTERAYVTKLDQEIPKLPQQIEEQSTARIDTEGVTKLQDAEPLVTEKQHVSNSDQEEVPKIIVPIDKQSTSQSDSEAITKLNDVESYTTEKQYVTKSDEEDKPKISEHNEEESTARTETEIVVKQEDSGSLTTEKQYVSISDQAGTTRNPVIVDEQSIGDIESITKQDDTEPIVTEKQYMSISDQEKVTKIPIAVDEESTAQSDMESVTKVNDIVPYTTEKKYETNEEVSENSELPKKPSTDETDVEAVSKIEDSVPFNTETPYVTLFEQEVPKIPEQVEDHSTPQYDSVAITKLGDTEPYVTEKQYVSKSDQEETPKLPVLSEEPSTSRIDTESVTKLEDNGSDHEDSYSHKLDDNASKPDPEQSIDDSEKITTEPLSYSETTIKSELEDSDLLKPSQEVTIVPLLGSSSTPDEVATPTKIMTETVDDSKQYSTERNIQTSVPADETITLKEIVDAKPYETEHKTPSKSSTEEEGTYSETTPYSVLLEEHTHSVLEDVSSNTTIEEDTTVRNEVLPERGDQIPDIPDTNDEYERTTAKPIEDERTTSYDKISSPIVQTGDAADTPPSVEKVTSGTGVQDDDKKYSSSIEDEKLTTPILLPTIEEKEQHTTSSTMLEKELTTLAEIITSSAEPELVSSSSKDDIAQELLPSSTSKLHEEPTTHLPPAEDKYKDKPLISSPPPSSSEMPDILEEPHEDEHLPDFPPSGTGVGYGQEPDYVEEDQAFGPGTCRYGGKVYVSAQQIPRDDPCDFCFCFRSDIICLQQSCPPPIHGCHEEPIQGFCCPRYECPVSMATTVNVTTTTTTTTTTLPPHFLPHAYKGAAQRRGCQIKGHSYKVGEVVRASSGPCLHCTCGGDGQMKCDPKACTPEPMLRQMIAAAVSAKRRR